MRQQVFTGIAVIIFVFVCIFTSVCFAQGIPQTISFQGILESGGTTASDGNYDFIFKIYNQEAGGTSLWQESYTDVNVMNGVYSVILGSLTPLYLPFDEQYWIGVTVGSDPEMTPLVKLTSVPTAFNSKNAESADSLQGQPVSAINPTIGQVLTWDGTEWASSAIANVATSGNYNDLSNLPPATTLTSTQVSNLQTDKLATGATPWSNASQLTTGTVPNARLDTDLQDLANDGQLSATRIQYGSYFINNQGSSGQVWKSDGSGAGYWGADNVGSSAWTTSGSNVYRNSGNVGIGTASPGNALDIVGDINVTGAYKADNTAILSYDSTGLFVGKFAGDSNAGSHNTFVGYSAGRNNENADGNTFIGYRTGDQNVSGQDNTYIGEDAGGNSINGDGNTYIGFESGYNATGEGNVFIGHQAGYNETGYNKLYISNSSTSNPLIYGDFGYRRVGIATSNPGSYTLYVNGSSYSTGGWSSSDYRWKKNIQPLENCLEKVSNLKGISYVWKKDEFPGKNFSEGTEIGLIAQDVEEVIPELVHTDDDGYKSVSYEKITAVLIEAIKELKEEQRAEIKQLEDEIAALKAKLH